MPKSKLTDLQKVELVEKYKTGQYTYHDLAREYGLGGSAIIGLLKRRGIAKLHNTNKLIRKYSLNEHYFDVIDSEDKAYFLGLLYADGCNHSERNEISLSLQSSDIDILERFNEKILSDRPIHIYKRQPNPKTSTPKDRAVLLINSKIMSIALTKHGCVKRKSLILEFPVWLSKSLVRHFIRGYFDGDGNMCLYNIKTRNSKKLTTQIVSSTLFIKKLSEILKNEYNINNTIKTHKNPLTSSLCVSGINVAYSFLEFLYRDCNCRLNRKYEYFLMIENYKNTINKK